MSILKFGMFAIILLELSFFYLRPNTKLRGLIKKIRGKVTLNPVDFSDYNESS